MGRKIQVLRIEVKWLPLGSFYDIELLNMALHVIIILGHMCSEKQNVTPDNRVSDRMKLFIARNMVLGRGGQIKLCPFRCNYIAITSLHKPSTDFPIVLSTSLSAAIISPSHHSTNRRRIFP
jgi:hypothetical protein